MRPISDIKFEELLTRDSYSTGEAQTTLPLSVRKCNTNEKKMRTISGNNDAAILVLKKGLETRQRL